MLGSPISALGRFGYGIFYTVPVSYLYLYTSEISFPSSRIPYASVILALLLLSLYAAVWMQRAALLIFGDGGGIESVRDKKVSRKHLVFFATGVEPQKLPDTKSIFHLIWSAVHSGYSKWLMVRFLPVSLFPLYAWIGWGGITYNLIQTGGELFGAGLWLILSIFLFRSRIAGYLPTYIPRENLENIDEAEYVATHREVHQANSEKSHTPRIHSNRSDEPSDHYDQ